MKMHYILGNKQQSSLKHGDTDYNLFNLNLLDINSYNSWYQNTCINQMSSNLFSQITSFVFSCSLFSYWYKTDRDVIFNTHRWKNAVTVWFKSMIYWFQNLTRKWWSFINHLCTSRHKSIFPLGGNAAMRRYSGPTRNVINSNCTRKMIYFTFVIHLENTVVMQSKSSELSDIRIHSIVINKRF